MARKHNHIRGVQHHKPKSRRDSNAVMGPLTLKVEAVRPIDKVEKVARLATKIWEAMIWVAVAMGAISAAILWFLKSQYGPWIAGGVVLLVVTVKTVKLAYKNLESDTQPTETPPRDET